MFHSYFFRFLCTLFLISFICDVFPTLQTTSPLTFCMFIVATGDAMEIEEDDTNAASGKIYVNMPVVSPATPHHRAQPLAQPPAHPQPQPQRQLPPPAPVQVHNQLPPQSQLSPQPRVSLLGAYPAAQPQQRPVLASQVGLKWEQ